MALLKEFLNENANRSYPFSVANAVPTALIVDFGAVVSDLVPDNTGDVEENALYINKVVTDGITVGVGLGALIDGTAKDFGTVATISVGQDTNQQVNFKVVSDGMVIEGFVTFGTTLCAPSMPPVITLDATTGLVYSGCLQKLTEWIMGFKVGDTTLSGVVELVAGPGIEINADQSTGKITITCTGAAVPVGNADIVDDQTLLGEIVSLYGAPITQINGESIVTSGGDGAWTIGVVPGDDNPYGNTLQVTTDPETSTIEIADTNATACCTQDQINTLVNNIGELNTRVGTLEGLQTQLETNINTVSTQLTRVL